MVGSLSSAPVIICCRAQIYNGVAGLFDLGPPGCAMKENLLTLWRQHFVLAQRMLPIECTTLTPYNVRVIVGTGAGVSLPRACLPGVGGVWPRRAVCGQDGEGSVHGRVLSCRQATGGPHRAHDQEGPNDVHRKFLPRHPLVRFTTTSLSRSAARNWSA